jgi:hypothetical protein
MGLVDGRGRLFCKDHADYAKGETNPVYSDCGWCERCEVCGTWVGTLKGR